MITIIYTAAIDNRIYVTTHAEADEDIICAWVEYYDEIISHCGMTVVAADGEIMFTLPSNWVPSTDQIKNFFAGKS